MTPHDINSPTHDVAEMLWPESSPPLTDQRDPDDFLFVYYINPHDADDA